MTKPIRVRYAPSPTGHPHVGNIRTALFNWLFARHQGGKFIVRIEDTDTARKVEGAVGSILESLGWLGMDWDEGPFYQSERLELYKEAVEKLIAQGDAYRCYCSSERLTEMRAEQQKLKQPPGYDRRCRDLSDEERRKIEAEGGGWVVRFKTPLTGSTKFTDLIWGEVEFEHSTQDDFVILKSDGYPTYHLASVVDDNDMKISHVLRAEEWISSTPRHLMLYDALGLEPPEFAHLPMILGPDKAKLSKRHGAVSIKAYYEQGYLAQAMVNFLALLGWSLDDKTDVISREDLIANFTLDRVSRTAAVFNQEKLLWMNGVYIRALSAEGFFQAAQSFLMSDGAAGKTLITDEGYVRRVLPLVQERVKRLDEVVELTSFFFRAGLNYDPADLIGKKMDKESTLRALEESLNRLKALVAFDAASLEGCLRPLAEELNLKAGQLFGVLRVAVTGRKAAPPLFETMEVLGQGCCLERIGEALKRLSA